jgi:hypothetical protein
MGCTSIAKAFSFTEPLVGLDDCPIYQTAKDEKTAQGKGVPQQAHFDKNTPRLQTLLASLDPLLEFAASDTAAHSTLAACYKTELILDNVNAQIFIAQQKKESKPFLLAHPGSHLSNLSFSSFYDASRRLMALQYESVLAGLASLVGLHFKSGSLVSLAAATTYQKSKTINWPVSIFLKDFGGFTSLLIMLFVLSCSLALVVGVVAQDDGRLRRRRRQKTMAKKKGCRAFEGKIFRLRSLISFFMLSFHFVFQLPFPFPFLVSRFPFTSILSLCVQLPSLSLFVFMFSFHSCLSTSLPFPFPSLLYSFVALVGLFHSFVLVGVVLVIFLIVVFLFLFL